MALAEETPRAQWRMHRLYARMSANSCALRITWQMVKRGQRAAGVRGSRAAPRGCQERGVRGAEGSKGPRAQAEKRSGG